MKDKCTSILKDLTGKKYIFFTNRGNTSIKLALKLAKHLGKKELFMQDQGGWITYDQFAKKLKFEISLLKTDYGLVKELPYLDDKNVLLINSMPGYFRLQDNMREISKKCFTINDISGSIGNDNVKYGDIIIGSFGRWKPINLEYGGFIAFDNKDFEDFFKENLNKELEDFYAELYEKLMNLDKRLKQFQDIKNKILKEIKDFDVIQGDGINVIVRFNNDKEKENIIQYCEKNNFQYTICPLYIKVLEDAISIEVKRL